MKKQKIEKQKPRPKRPTLIPDPNGWAFRKMFGGEPMTPEEAEAEATRLLEAAARRKMN